MYNIPYKFSDVIDDNNLCESLFHSILDRIVDRKPLLYRELKGRFLLENDFIEAMKSHLICREFKAYQTGPLGWSGDSRYYGEELNFLGVRMDVLDNHESDHCLFVGRHEIQHEIQRVRDYAQDYDGFFARLSYEHDANTAAYLFLAAYRGTSPVIGKIKQLVFLLSEPASAADPYQFALGGVVFLASYVAMLLFFSIE